MSFLRFLSIAGIASLASASALAADYEPPVYADQPIQEYVPVEVGSGWYLRGDVGYNFSTKAKGDFAYRTFDPVSGTYDAARFDSGSFGEGVTGGVGFGYNFTDYFRADATFDVFKATFDGTTSSSLPCGGLSVGSCRSEDSADATAYSVMANAYVDLGTYVGFTPYVGAGLGATYVNWDNLGSNAYCVGATCPPPGAFAASTQNDGGKSWRFTWALMAGLAYDISNNLKIDLGYRYRDIEGGEMFEFDRASQLAGATGVQGNDPGFRTHEVRIGLRYALW